MSKTLPVIISPYKMTIDLNVLNSLGMKLYSNVPAVLSEVVANSWDADSDSVEITIEPTTITINDNGSGMDRDMINDCYLTVGYQKRDNQETPVTPKWKRQPMGRKGIGKLSLFSIADLIEVHTMRGKEKFGFILNGAALRNLLKSKKKEDYRPGKIESSKVKRTGQGTTIILKKLKKNVGKTPDALTKRIARRFSVLDPKENFNVSINGKKVTILDRDYFHKVQYVWYFGKDSAKYAALTKATFKAQRDNVLNVVDENLKVSPQTITGWIGTVKGSGDLKDGNDNLNKIVVMVRGKLAQEDILEDYAEGGVYSKYVLGEIHANFLDTDERDDIATSNRQEIIKDDPRYEAIQAFLKNELSHIRAKWTDLRNEEGTKVALDIPAINEWFMTLGPDRKKKAKSLFGKINQLTIEDSEKRQLFKHSVLAFESLSLKDSLDRLDAISADNIGLLTQIFPAFDDFEATMYYQLIRERMEIVRTLHEKVDSNQLEKLIQQYLFNHLWIIDPSWERATETPVIEESVSTEFQKLDAKLSPDELKGRIDIRYRSVTGAHVIVELKRPDRSIDSNDLQKQVSKYQRALKKVLRASGRQNEPIETVCVVGKPCKDWDDDKESESVSRQALRLRNIRVVYYYQLIEDAYGSYKRFLEKQREANDLIRLIDKIDEMPVDDSLPDALVEPATKPKARALSKSK